MKEYDSVSENYEDRLISKDDFESFFIRMGLRPACYIIDIDYMEKDYEEGCRMFKFYLNPHKLVFYMKGHVFEIREDQIFRATIEQMKRDSRLFRILEVVE